MEKLLLFVCLLLLLPSCSSDDNDEKLFEVFMESDLQAINTDDNGKYYFSDDLNLFVTSPLLVFGHERLMSSAAYCPKEHEDMPLRPLMKAKIIKAYPDGEVHFECSSCHAEYSFLTGEPANEIAKGSNLRVYRTTNQLITGEYKVFLK